MYDYYLGGDSHSAADEESARNAIASFGDLQAMARENRAVLLRATTVRRRACRARRVQPRSALAAAEVTAQ
jgi:hypothetical protein